MAMSWTDIFPDVDGDPVVGEPGEFSDVSSMFAEMGTAAEDIKSQFDRFKSESEVDNLQGDAADAFRTVVDKVAGSLDDLPGVCSAAERVMRDHHTRLADLRDAADQALARARTRWEAHEDAKRALESRQAASRQLAAQLDGLPPAGADPAGDAERTSLEGDAADARSAVSSAEGAVDGAAGDLEASRREWDGLRDDERSLDDTTASALGDIRLGDLDDPSWWESILGSAFDLVLDLTGIEALLDLVEAIASGDWAAALWHLREILDRVLTIVAIVALFTPLGPLVLALAAVKLATTIALYATQWPNPETGQTAGLMDVALDGADVLGAAGDVARTASRGVDAATEAGRGGRAVSRAVDERVASDAADGALDIGASCPPAPPGGHLPEVGVSRGRYPQSARHIEDAQANGHPSELTIDRAGAAQRRRESMRGQPRQPGLDRDEYPPAVFSEGGTGSSVRAIDPSDNRGAGAAIGNQIRGCPDGTRIRLTVTP